MDEWDTVTKIGSKTNGGTAQRETVVRGKGALNKAQRTGAIIATEKKFATGNAASKSTPEGQRMTKVDRTDDVIAPPKMDPNIGQNITKRRTTEGPYKMNQEQLAKAVNVPKKEIVDLESAKGAKNQAVLNKVCRRLGLSPKTGEPLPGKE